LTSLPIYSDDVINNSLLLNFKNFQPFSNELNLDNNDESYENTKYLNYIYYLNYKNILSFGKNALYPISYTTILDMFQSNYEDNYLFFDNMYNLNSMLYNNLDKINLNNEARLSNPLKIRPTAKNSIVQFNAIQKVFRSRFDEGRSNSRLQDFSNSYNKHPFISEPKPEYESMLGKNKENFFKINMYNQYTKLNFSNIFTYLNSINVYFLDIPFLISLKSDPTRYLWFD
jgi:hypothetical protein